MISWFITLLGRFLITAISRTLRLSEVNNGFIKERVDKQGKPVIFAFWHNRLFYLIYYMPRRFIWRGHKVSALVSLSRDGEMASRVANKFGVDIVRGSSSRRGGAGLIKLCRRAEKDFSPAITLDGPRGPKYQVQPGIVLLAQKTGLPIVPITYQVEKSYVFDSWDNFILPFPFNRIRVIYGEPIFVRPDVDETERDRVRLELRDNLIRLSSP